MSSSSRFVGGEDSSRLQSRTRFVAKTTEKAEQNFSPIQQMPLPLNRHSVLPCSLNDGPVVRGLLAEVMRTCGKSRAQIADEMSYLVGQEVTERRLNGFTAESREDLRWPAELDRAFCLVTGDNRLLTYRAELAGLHVISSEDFELLELGRAIVQRAHAEEKIALLQRRLGGREL